MYYRGNKKYENKEIPFDVICTNCGSHNVTVVAYGHWDLEFKCENCGSNLSDGKYNPMKYED